MRALNPIFVALLKCLNAADVKYLVVGGFAVNFYGHHRNTKDIDIWIATDTENAKRVSKALQDFGFAPEAVRPKKFTMRGEIYSFGRDPFRIDLLTNPSGVEFESCYNARIEAESEGVRVPWLSLDDLRTNKRASGRIQDLADLKNLPPAKSPTRQNKRRRK